MLFDQRIYGEAWKPVVSHTARVPFRCNRKREREKETMDLISEIDFVLFPLRFCFFVCVLFLSFVNVWKGGCRKRYIRVIETWNKI